MTDYRCMFSTLDRHRKLNQLRWQNMSAHLTNETSYLLKKLLMHLNWAIYDVCDLNIDPHVCFFPTLSQDRARPIPLAQPEACPQRSERPVCDRSPHRSQNGYPGWYWQSVLYRFHTVTANRKHGGDDETITRPIQMTGLFYSHGLNHIRAWMTYYISVLCGIQLLINYSCLKLKSGLTKPGGCN